MFPRALDYGFTTDISFAALVQKGVINGWRKAITDFRQLLPTHVFQYVEVFGRLKILEMAIDKNDHHKMRLTMSSVTKYDKNGPFGNRIIARRRCALYDDQVMRAIANDRHLRRWANGITFYDIPELFSFVFGNKNNPDKWVCSSELENELNKDGYTFGGFPLERNGLISPWDIMKVQYVMNHNGNKYPIVNL
jgi:hypothetical protein